MILTTLCFLIGGDKVLLAMKKRGFGAGKFNGVGGKLETGESVAESVIREAEEEIGVKIALIDAKHHAKILFSFDNKPDWNQECHVFVSDRWQGEPRETEEMAPKWFRVAELPFHKMWVDDAIWLPKVLARERIEAEFLFTPDGKEILSHSIKVTP